MAVDFKDYGKRMEKALDHQSTGIGRRDVSNTVQCCLRTIVFHSNAVKNLCIGSASADSAELLLQVVQSFFHSSVKFLKINGHNNSPP